MKAEHRRPHGVRRCHVVFQTFLSFVGPTKFCEKWHYELRATNYGLLATNYKLLATNYQVVLRTTKTFFRSALPTTKCFLVRSALPS